MLTDGKGLRLTKKYNKFSDYHKNQKLNFKQCHNIHDLKKYIKKVIDPTKKVIDQKYSNHLL